MLRMLEGLPMRSTLFCQPRIQFFPALPPLIKDMLPNPIARILYILFYNPFFFFLSDIAEIRFKQIMIAHDFKARIDDTPAAT